MTGWTPRLQVTATASAQPILTNTSLSEPDIYFISYTGQTPPVML